MKVQDFVDALASGYNADDLKKMIDDAVEQQNRQGKLNDARNTLVEATTDYIELLTGETVTKEENADIKRRMIAIEREIGKIMRESKTTEKTKDSFADFLKGYKYF